MNKVIATAVGAAAVMAAPLIAPAVAQATPSVVYLYDCWDHRQFEPSSYVLMCADAGDLISNIHWSSWTPQAAIGTGSEDVKICVPNCADGGLSRTPVSLRAWAPQDDGYQFLTISGPNGSRTINIIDQIVN